jgi:gamma-glutamylcyclotransferase (GGCT)/AIG2-like uncharacterized protein YtfP
LQTPRSQGHRAVHHGPTGRAAHSGMADLVFFYGTLMTPFNRTGRRYIDDHLVFRGRGVISGVLFDLGIYPAAVPASDAQVWGEVYEMVRPELVLEMLDEIEGYRHTDPETSLYTRTLVPVMMETGECLEAWVYFYNAPLGRAERIPSGDYLEHLTTRPLVFF